MVDTVTVSRKHHSGLDADKAGITGVIGETYGATDSGKLYYWNTSLSAWKTGLGYEFVPRAVAAADFTQADFTLDGAWHADAIDCSVIVPAGAVAIEFFVEITDNVSGTQVGVRGNATTKTKNIVDVTSHVVNVPNSAQGKVYCDADRLLDSYASAGITVINLYILGWYI